MTSKISELEVYALINEGEKLHSLVQRTGYTYLELKEMRDRVEASAADIAIEAMELIPARPATADPAMNEAYDEFVAEGDYQSARDVTNLDENMHGLANHIIEKLDTFASVATEAHQVYSIVESLACLRSAFYGKGATVNVNTQNNNGGGDPEVSRFKGLLKP